MSWLEAAQTVAIVFLMWFCTKVDSHTHRYYNENNPHNTGQMDVPPCKDDDGRTKGTH